MMTCLLTPATTAVACSSSLSSKSLRMTPTARSRLRSRLSELNLLIATLTERDALQAESDAIVYPVLSLPPEITTEIFQRCISHQAMNSPLEAPLLLTQICHEWREIAQASPQLWHSLSFLRRYYPVEVLQTWLPRSGDLPLDFAFYCNSTAGADAMLETSLRHSHRWQDVDLGLPVESFSKLRLDQVQFSILRKISFAVTRHPLEDYESPAIALRNVPSLREACIGTLPYVTIDLPWHQLQNLTLHVVPIGDCLSLLAGCPQLRHLDVVTTGVAGPQIQSSQSHLTLSHLESLIFDVNTTAAHSSSLLVHLTLPRLGKLTVGTHSAQLQHTALLSLTRRSAYPLHTFELEIGAVWHDAFRRCLAALPASLTHLTLTWEGEMQAQFGPLADPGMLPHLKYLTLRGGRFTHDRSVSLVDALDARGDRGMLVAVSLTGFSPLRDIKRLFEGYVLGRLRALAKEGMKIRVVIAGSAPSKEVLIDSLT